MNELKPILKQIMLLAKKRNFPRKAFLVNEGDVCKEIFFIEKGCLRSWFNDNGRDITFQFYFEDEAVSSFESLRNSEPCLFNIETLTPAVLHVLGRDVFFEVVNNSAEFTKIVNDYSFNRLYHYQRLFISRITNSPERRYEELLEQNPEILKRVPQHYIATYLGITPVSLSRIINKKNKNR